MKSRNVRNINVRFVCILLVLIMLMAVPISALDLPNFPVLVKSRQEGKILFINDDSGSMITCVEHEDYDKNSAVATNNSFNIPDVIMRLNTNGNSPSTGHALTPALINFNGYIDRYNPSGDQWAGSKMADYANIPLIREMGCTSSTNGNCIAPGDSNSRGYHNAEWYDNSSVRGSSVFQTSRLDPTDIYSDGDRTLQFNYYRNVRGDNENWNGYFLNFDGSGNNQSYVTRAYVSNGQSVVFNGKEVFLGACIYDVRYLRWIFYGASAAQRASLPGKSRLGIVKDTLETMVNDNPDSDFGLAVFNGTRLYPASIHSRMRDQFYKPEGYTATGQFPVIYKEAGTTHSELLKAIDLMGTGGGTPIFTTYVEVARYFAGQTERYGRLSGSPLYDSPIDDPCHKPVAILATDGSASSEQRYTRFGSSYITNHDGDGDEWRSNNSACGSSSSCIVQFMDDAAYLFRTTDIVQAQAGVQTLTTYVIGLGFSLSIMDDTATNGGSQYVRVASTASEINSALRDIISEIITTTISGAGASTTETLSGDNKMYRTRFQATNWQGDMDAYSIDNNGTSSYLWSAGSILESRDLTSSPRTILAGLDTNYDGRTSSSVAFTTGNRATLRPYLFRQFSTGVEDTSALETVLASQDNSAAEKIIDFIHGERITGLRDMDTDNDGNRWKLFDIVFSKSTTVESVNSPANFPLTGYASYVDGRASQPKLVLVGSNGGGLHAFNANTGVEEWSYIPSSLIPHLEKLTRGLYGTQYRRPFVDGQIQVEDVWIQRLGAWRTLAMFGLREGGSQYVVLDITNRTSPSLLWEVNNPEHYGDSWTIPAVARTGGNATSTSPSSVQWRMVVGTGQNKATSGTKLVTYNLNSATPPSPIVRTIESGSTAGLRTTGITLANVDGDIAHDRGYLGTETGEVYRIGITGNNPATWNVTKLFNGNSTQPITARPTVVLVDNPRYNGGTGTSSDSRPLAAGVYVGTGRLDNLSDSAGLGSSTMRLVGIMDPIDTVADSVTYGLSNITLSSLQNQTGSGYDIRVDADKIGRVPTNKYGWTLEMPGTLSLVSNYIKPAGMMIYPMTNFRGALFASTYLPNVSYTCEASGHGLVTALNFRTGGGTIIDSSDLSDVKMNGAVPDYNASGSCTTADVTSAYNANALLPLMDVRAVASSADPAYPYVHDGDLLANDVYLDASTCGIKPASTSNGSRGATSQVAVNPSSGLLIFTESYPEATSTDTLTETGTDDGTNGGTVTPDVTFDPTSVTPSTLDISTAHVNIDIVASTIVTSSD